MKWIGAIGHGLSVDKQLILQEEPLAAKVIGKPQGQGDHREPGANARAAGQNAAVGDVEVLELMAFAVRVYH